MTTGGTKRLFSGSNGYPERKGAKNRLHLDIEVASLEPAAERVRSLGGAIVQETRSEYGVDFVIAADPEGNEFCLIQPLRH